jgi:dCTP deaminase
MTVLADWEIRSFCEASQMVTPFDEKLLNPASLDLRLGPNLMIEVRDQPELMRIDISTRTKDDPYLLLPGEVCLAETVEQFNLPESISAQFVLKSSRARDFYGHMLAGWCDPGWNGSRLTLELKNERKHHPLPLYPGMKIGQMVFFRMSAVPLKSYALTGHYNNHKTVMPNVV